MNRRASGWETQGTRLAIAGSSPDDPDMLRVTHARASVTLKSSPARFFDAFAARAGYERWAPDIQGAHHWLLLREGGPGSEFICYDKPGPRHLVHFGRVTEVERGRRLSWRAAFGEWSRAQIGTTLQIEPFAGGARATETLFFDVREEHLPVIGGFAGVIGFDEDTLSNFLERRLAGLDGLLERGDLPEADVQYPFSENRVVAADWANRTSAGEWVRVLYADGEVDLPAPPEVVFPILTRWARYADWTHDVHVGAEWHEIRRGGVGSRFLLWEKPGDRHVMHYGTMTEFERNVHFAWRAPFAEWDKVYIGTSGDLFPRDDGGTHMYHVIWVDMPREYLPTFAGFGTLRGFDIEYETWHVQEEIRGFNRLLRDGGFSAEDRSYLFDEDRIVARDFPMERGRPHPYPDEVLNLKPDTVLTFEELSVEVAQMLAKSIPGPAFFREQRSQRRTLEFARRRGLK